MKPIVTAANRAPSGATREWSRDLRSGVRTVALDKRPPLAKLAYEAIKQRITSLELPPGSTVTADQLGVQLGVSQTPVREALTMLSQERLVQAKHRTGYVIAPITVRDVQDVFQIRLVLEPLAVELGMRRATEADLVAFGKALSVEPGLPSSRLSRDDPEFRHLTAEFHDRFHLAVAGLSRNEELVDMIRNILDKSRRMHLLGVPYPEIQPSPVQPHGAHSVVAKAILERASDVAAAAMKAHVRSVYRVIMESLSPIESTADDGKPDVLE